ncbi:MAG: rubrerythrin family protein [Candidatus Gastranaerophilales bacterium]
MFNKEKIRGTQTERNLINSFAGESQARNRYTYFAKLAKKEGYEQIAAIFLETAEQEKEHAKLFYDFIPAGHLEVSAYYPFMLGTTEENLESAAAGEHEEWDVLYVKGEQDALEEGFVEIAETFKQVRHAEIHHERRYLRLLEQVRNKTVFHKDYEAEWVCRECGYVIIGKSAPEKCPNCHHPQAYYQLLCEEF